MERFFDLATEPRIAGAEALYCRRRGGAVDYGETYFNGIPYEKIKKYTAISKIEVRDNSVFVESDSINRVNCAIIFCTYKREEYIKRNVNYLSEKLKGQCDFEYKIIVTDNGKTLSNKDFSDDVILIENANSGGSGGFGRGMREAAKIGGFTHFVLMDDDIEIDFVSIQKMLNFLRFVKPEYRSLAIAGSMLFLDKPTVQFEAGGHFGQDGIQKGFGYFLDLTETENLILNEKENDINYGGWWMMCMPFKYIEEGNFPLPFFLKYDDVEYALRCRPKIITLNGVGVWHEKFESKYNSASEYYNMRNYLYLCSLHCKGFDLKKAEKIAKKRIREKEKRQQHKMAEAARLGFEDFMKGMEWLRTVDSEENHKRISALNYEFLSYDEIEKRYGVRPENGKFYAPPGRKKLLDLRTWLPKKYVFTDSFFDKPVQYLNVGFAVHCDSSFNRAYVTNYFKDSEKDD